MNYFAKSGTKKIILFSEHYNFVPLHQRKNIY